MALKLFTKSTQETEETLELIEAPSREQRLENNLRDLSLELLQLRQDVNSMLNHQQSFKMALSRLKDYMEDRGAIEENSQELQAPFQELLPEEGGTPGSLASSRKHKQSLH
ncbi:MAG: hypothetical protein NTX25_06960 [Proteobacteria bacterium]|nr:hypothetical protein [Pseudomonadota bacterium]